MKRSAFGALEIFDFDLGCHIGDSQTLAAFAHIQDLARFLSVVILGGIPSLLALFPDVFEGLAFRQGLVSNEQNPSEFVHQRFVEFRSRFRVPISSSL